MSIPSESTRSFQGEHSPAELASLGVAKRRREIATSRHLHQSVRYRSAGSQWCRTPIEALSQTSEQLSWDAASLFSQVSLGYGCGDRMLVEQIVRQPWMSQIGRRGEVRREPIPVHGTRSLTAREIAERLRELLRAEAASACEGFSEIYVLLSGGLDSRLIAITLRDLHREGRLRCKPVAVTWGLEDSRDVYYGRELAGQLGFDWQHVSLEPHHLIENIDISAQRLGGLNWPTDLHRASWFRNVSPSALVLAGSEGDAIGRGESAGESVLERRGLAPGSTYGLLRPEVIAAGTAGLTADLAASRERASGRPRYGLFECEDEDQRHRSQLMHSIGVIDQYCHLYQMFTHPDLFSFVWSIHPAFRDDRVYRHLLALLDPELASLPWSRTNRSVVGKTTGARRGLRREFDLYRDWIVGPLYKQLRERIDPEWFAGTGLFESAGVRQLGEAIRKDDRSLRLSGKRPYFTWLWLATFREYAELLDQNGKRVRSEVRPLSRHEPLPTPPKARQLSRLRLVLRQSPTLLRLFRKARRQRLRRQALREFPITQEDRPSQ